MTKTPINLQELRRRIYRKAKSEKAHRFWGIFCVHVTRTREQAGLGRTGPATLARATGTLGGRAQRGEGHFILMTPKKKARKAVKAKVRDIIGRGPTPAAGLVNAINATLAGWSTTPGRQFQSCL